MNFSKLSFILNTLLLSSAFAMSAPPKNNADWESFQLEPFYNTFKNAIETEDIPEFQTIELHHNAMTHDKYIQRKTKLDIQWALYVARCAEAFDIKPKPSAKNPYKCLGVPKKASKDIVLEKYKHLIYLDEVRNCYTLSEMGQFEKAAAKILGEERISYIDLIALVKEKEKNGEYPKCY